MSDQNFLLTYITKEDKQGSYGWFPTEEELWDFVDAEDIRFLDAFEVVVLREIKRDFE